MMSLRPDLAVIADHVAPGSRVLDVGCGDGELMAVLRDEQAASMRAGWRSIPRKSRSASRAGFRWSRATPTRDLADYPDGAFDYAILSQTLQTAERPDLMLEQLLRIGRKAFVSFPNFAHWRMRASLLWNGRMPVTRLLAGELVRDARTSTT